MIIVRNYMAGNKIVKDFVEEVIEVVVKRSLEMSLKGSWFRS